MVSKRTAVHFNCPHCNALYHLVKPKLGRKPKIVR